MTARTALLLALVACGSSQRARLYPAGSDRDDGHGDLAQKSARLFTHTEPELSLFAARRGHRLRAGDPYGGDAYGGASYGGDPELGNIGDATFAPAWMRATPATHYSTAAGLTGALEGTVTWRGPLPPPVATACGSIANPSVRVGPRNAVGGVLVYIEHVDVGRALPSHGRPAGVGGMIAKRGCVLSPALQIVTPLPAGLAIHGDATEARLLVTLPAGKQPVVLQQAGRVLLQAQPGVTRVEADDGSLGAAWVVAWDTPYYAITDDTGKFRIDELAAGTYDVTFWRPPLPSAAGGKLIYGAPVITHRSIKIDPARPARLDVALER
ncbi:MAG TPA: hypothetical protein VFK02_25345 [Kofleriaceae bacterium]|nr:hypothetical protein [Kofleriaceae bacterium]